MTAVSRTLRVSYDVLPPSDNHIREVQYCIVQGKRRATIGYTGDAISYKKTLVRHINDVYFVDVQRFARAHKPTDLYLLTVVLHFPPEDILSAGWLVTNRRGERKAKNPYKRLDVMNRRKLLEDCLSEAIGIDDSLFWEGDNVKLVSQDGGARVDMLLEEVDPTGYGVPAEYVRGAHGR